MPTKEWDQECRPCKGTGLYIGFAEKSGAAVVCRDCRGTGLVHIKFEYNEFAGRKPRTNVVKVIGTNPGIVVDGGHIVPGGVSYEEWVENPASAHAPGNELRQHTCPAWWYQSADSTKKPRWEECVGGGAFYQCQYFEQKYLCWARWDRENAGGE